MDILVEVYDPDGNRIGQPLRNCSNFSVTRRLDGAGSMSISFPATDKKVAKYLSYKSRFKILIDDGSISREVGAGLINDDDFSESPSGDSLSFSAVDLLEELKYLNTLGNMRFNKASLKTVVEKLISYAPGWSVSASIVNPITARFDGATLLKALQEVTTNMSGTHFRLTGWKSLAVGTFGAAIDLKIFKPERITSTMRKKTNLAFISNIKITGRSKDIANRIYVFGAGQSLDTALTLKEALATRSIALGYDYDIYSIIRNGRTHYYIQDSASIADYGVIEKYGQYREIAPLSSSAADVQAAAEALYDAAAADLKRIASPQIVYSVDITNLKIEILPGDMIRLVYEDPIKRTTEAGGGTQSSRSIDAWFTVLSIKEQFSTKHTASLEISNIDQHPKTLAQKFFTSIEDLKVYANQIQPSVTAYPYSESIIIDSADSVAKTGTVQFPVQNFAYQVDRVYMRVRTALFESTSKGAAAGGDHYHRVARYAASFDPASYSVFSWDAYNFRREGGGSPTTVVMANSDQLDIHTEGGSGNHTHPPEYGVFRDTLYPGLMTIKVDGTVIDGTDITPVGSQSSSYDASFDITDAILNKQNGFRGIHEIEISCAEGRGAVIVNFDASIFMLPYQYLS